MSDKTAWERAAESEGITSSEQALTKLAKKAFLSLWSYSNVFTDEGRGKGKGDGKELCDLLVVFGNSVFLFSDKHCEYQTGIDVKIAWPRWYKRAIAKSVKQLSGAERFIKAFPRRVYIDKNSQTPLPVQLPDPSVAKYYLIAVTRGSHLAARSYFGGGSSGSLVLNTGIIGDEHFEHPFRVGYPLPGRFVHVLDELTVDILLEELDTVPDLVSYLEHKEAFLGQPGVIVSVPGEEELLARYMMTMSEGGHAFPKLPKGVPYIVLPEGDWAYYANSPQRAAKKATDEGSYMWDAAIEYHAKFIRAGTAVAPWTAPDEVDHERVVRAMASETRLARRDLAAHWRVALNRNEPGKKFARIQMSGQPLSRGYVFLTIPKVATESYAAYREMRMAILGTYCQGLKLNTPTLREAIGIASEPFADGIASQEIIYADLTPDLSSEQEALLRGAINEFDILQPATQENLVKYTAHEFPMPFHFGGKEGPGGVPFMNRAERRRAEREARKLAKKMDKKKG